MLKIVGIAVGVAVLGVSIYNLQPYPNFGWPDVGYCVGGITATISYLFLPTR